MQRKELKELGWPVNLLTEVFGELEYPITAERTALIEKAVTETLSERESGIIISHFQKLLTLKETGNIYNITGSRAREIECRALRKLRHPSRWSRFFPKGFNDYHNQEGFKTLEEMDDADKKREQKICEREREKEDIVERQKSDEGSICRSISKRVIEKMAHNEYIDKEDREFLISTIPMEDVIKLLGTRAQNILRIRNSRYFRNIIQLMESIVTNQLRYTKNVGIKTYNEILKAIDTATCLDGYMLQHYGDFEKRQDETNDVEIKHEEVEVINQYEIIERVLQTIDSGKPISKEDFNYMLVILPIEKIHELLNVRASNAIASCGIVNIVQLLYSLRSIYKDENIESNYLCSVRNIGRKSYLEILNALDKLFKTFYREDGAYHVKYSRSFYNRYSHMQKYVTVNKDKRIYRIEEALYKTPDKYWWYKCYPSGNMFERINAYAHPRIDVEEEKNESEQIIVNGYDPFSLRYENFHLPRLNEAYPYNLISTITGKEIEYISRPYGNIVTHFEDIIISAINRITNNNERMTNKLCYILTLRFKYNKTYLEISNIMDIAPTAAREIVDNIISTVRNYMNSLPYQYFPDDMFINEKER